MSDLTQQQVTLDEITTALDQITDQDAGELRDLCEQFVRLRNLQDTAINLLDDIKAQHRRYERELVPDAMDALGMRALTTDSGVQVNVKDDIHASISKDNMSQAYEWLRTNNHGDLIKNQVQVTFNRNQDNLAGDFYADAMQKGLDVERKERVHPSTLKAWVREMRTKGVAVPMETFGVYEGRIAKMSSRKGE